MDDDQHDQRSSAPKLGKEWSRKKIGGQRRAGRLAPLLTAAKSGVITHDIGSIPSTLIKSFHISTQTAQKIYLLADREHGAS